MRSRVLLLVAGITLASLAGWLEKPEAGYASSFLTSRAMQSVLRSSPAQAAGQTNQPGAAPSSISTAAYTLINARVAFNRTNFFVYRDADSAFNHGFPSGIFGNVNSVNLNPACIDDPHSSNGCSTDSNRLDRTRGNVLQVSFTPTPGQTFAGLNIEEPENWGVTQAGVGYDLRNATAVVFDVRSPTGITVSFGVNKCPVELHQALPAKSTYTTMTIPLSSLGCTDFSNVHVLFTVGWNAVDSPSGGIVLLDNIRFTPAPKRQSTDPKALSLPLGTQTFGVIPLSCASGGCVPIPPDQINRNVASIYESALTLIALLKRGQGADLTNAREIANAFDYALTHDNHGDPLPVAPDGSAGLHNAYTGGDIAFLNDQVSPKQGKAGDVRLAGFTAQCLYSSTGFCLVLDGATGGNDAFAILALAAAYEKFKDVRYLNDARTIGNWIAGNLTDTTGTGYGGYYFGYPDQGLPKTLETNKSTENNADVSAAFSALAGIETQLGNTTEAAMWTSRANVAGDFVMLMFDSANGRFNAGTVPVGTPPSPGVCPNGPQQGNDVIDTCDFLDANSFSTLALSASPRYQNQIDWRRPVNFVLSTFVQSLITAGGKTYQGFDLVPAPVCGNNGIAWEFTGQAVELMLWVDQLYGETTFASQAQFYLSQIAVAQTSAPFGDGEGVVASTLQNGDTLPPLDQCLNTPFQCIPERVGLAATNWAIFSEQSENPLALPVVTISPKSLNFPKQLVGTSSSAKVVTLTNGGSAPLTISAITITGANSGDFSQTNNCPVSSATLAAGSSCTINVTFTPLAGGNRVGSLTVGDDAFGSPQSVSLSGLGTAVSLSPSSLNFGKQQVGTSSAPLTVTLHNAGSVTLNIFGIAMTGTNASDFSQSNNCGSAVTAGGNCTINVTFSPAAKGSRHASLSVSDDGGASPQTVSLSGTGT